MALVKGLGVYDRKVVMRNVDTDALCNRLGKCTLHSTGANSCATNIYQYFYPETCMIGYQVILDTLPP
jgi:hypothetical protein